MRGPAVHGEQAAPLNADARSAQCLAHDSQPISPPAELDLQIKHRAHLPSAFIVLTTATQHASPASFRPPSNRSPGPIHPY